MAHRRFRTVKVRPVITNPTDPATPKQINALWRFAVRRNPGLKFGEVVAWNISKGHASKIISAIIAGNNEMAAALLSTARDTAKLPAPPEDEPEVKAKPEAEPESDGGGDEKGDGDGEDEEGDVPDPAEDESKGPAEDTPEEPAEDDDAGDEVSRKRRAYEAAVKRAAEKKAKEKAERETKERLEKEAKEAKDKGTPPPPPADGEFIRPQIFESVYRAVMAGINVLLVGPAGCGKTRLAEEVAKAANAPFHTASLGGGVRYAQLFGATALKDGKTEWVPSDFLKWVQEPGVVLLDEIFGADPDVLLGLNGILESRTRAINTPLGIIRVHPECRLIAAANNTGRVANDRQYRGIQRSDDSLLDRLSLTFELGYDEGVEQKILCKIGASAPLALDYMKRLRALREKVKINNIPYDPSTRRLLAAVRATMAGIEAGAAWEAAFLSCLSAAERAKVA